MPFSFKLYLPITILLLSSCGVFSQHANFSLAKKNTSSLKDSTNIYHKMFNDRSDDLMENHPADDIYNFIWTRERINPYKIPLDSLPDSVRIDCSHFVVPTHGSITSPYGPRHYRFHYGLDLRVKIGDSIVSAFSGKVRIIDYEARGYGHYVVVRHNNGLETVYAHLSKVLVEHNQNVKAGELIALGGNTGHSTGPHLHFEMRYIGNAINPANIVNFTTGLVNHSSYLLTKRNSFFYQREVKAVKVTRYYKVRKGDTLSEIAARNGTSVNALSRLNGLKKNKLLKLGQNIRIR